MKPSAPVLAATDLSAPARDAVARACWLAAQGGSELHILHALELDALDTLRDMLGAKLAPTKDALEAEALERLARLAADLTRSRGVTAQTRVVSGTPLATVTREADALAADLIVLGFRGESFLRHAMLGSTAARLLRKSVRQTVLVVKQPPHEAYRRVLVAVDFSSASLSAILAARRWAPDAELLLLHAFELPYEGKLWVAGIEQDVISQHIQAGIDKRRKQLHELAADAGLEPLGYVARVVHGDPSRHIIIIEQEDDVDLIVVGKHGAHGAEELLLGSVTKRVLAEAQGDVMIVPDARAAPGDPY